MIITLTANPSIDRTVSLPAPLAPGEVQRATAVISQAGGKGVNIARAAASAGLPTLAVLPAPSGDPFVHDLQTAGIDCLPIDQPGDLRVNLTLSDPAGITTKVNTPGPLMTASTRDAIAAALSSRARGSDEPTWVVLAGSLPPGAPDDWYAVLLDVLAGSGAHVAVDTSDAPLQALVNGFRGGSAAPQLMKPNGHELASLTGRDGADLESRPDEAALAARELLTDGVGWVLATLGGHGAVLVGPDGAWHATPPPTTVVSTVGAGDSSLFGYLWADLDGASPPERLQLAVAYGSAAAGLPGTTIPEPGQVRPDRVAITALHLPVH